MIARFVTDNSGSKSHTCIPRWKVLILAGYLFAGVSEQLSELTIECNALGIVARLTLLTKACLGAISKPSDLGHFMMLDVDASSLPCNGRGIVLGGRSRASANPIIMQWRPDEKPTVSFDTLDVLRQDDFTIHLEPDWAEDLQALMLTYRHRGRVVHHLPPSHVEWGFARALSNTIRMFSAINEIPKNIVESSSQERTEKFSHDVCLLEAFQNNTLRSPRDGYGISVPVQGCVYAQACILAMYGSYAKTSPRTNRFHSEFEQIIMCTAEEVRYGVHDYRCAILVESTEPLLRVRDNADLVSSLHSEVSTSEH